MAKKIAQRKFFFQRFLPLNILLISIIFHSSPIHAEDAETTLPITTTPDNKERHTKDMEAALAQEISTEAIWFGAGEEVSIATRHETPAGKAPSIVTVITAEEIKNLGYRTFVEILRTVPGFEILKDFGFGTVSPAVRGVISSERIRVMLNGHHVNNPSSGGAFDNFDDFPVENIKKIEIIRGPASAVYGENALLSVINIITKDTKDIDGARVSSGYGSFDTYDENIVFGKTYGNVSVSGMARYRQTNGFDGIVKSDYQTILDKNLSLLGYPPVSEAPGKVHDARQEYDLNTKMVYKDIYVEGLYVNKRRGPFAGPQGALADGSHIENDYVFVDTGYKKTFEENFSFAPRIYYDQFDDDYFLKSLPDGTTIPDKNGKLNTFSNGVIGNGKIINRVVGTEIPFDYNLFDGNTLTLGFEYRLINQSNVQYLTNFNPVTLEPLGSIRNFSDTYSFMRDFTRRIWSVYLQDTWDITDTVNLTVGARHDQYSDFGGQTNPRAGLSWAFMKGASLKFLYGEAFRPPSFMELFLANQPAVEGNVDLKPEKIKTFEVGVSYQFNKHVSSSINYFHNEINDLIVLRALPYNNTTQYYENQDARVQGVEMETRVDIIKDNYIFMNYTFQNPEDTNGNDLPFVAHHHGNFGVNVHYWKYINTNLSTFVSGKRSREVGDQRNDLPAYALLNLSVIAKEFFKTMEIQGTVFNLLDKNYSDPGPTSIEGDLPRPGRTFFIGLSYQF